MHSTRTMKHCGVSDEGRRVTQTSRTTPKRSPRPQLALGNPSSNPQFERYKLERSRPSRPIAASAAQPPRRATCSASNNSRRNAQYLSRRRQPSADLGCFVHPYLVTEALYKTYPRSFIRSGCPIGFFVELWKIGIGSGKPLPLN